RAAGGALALPQPPPRRARPRRRFGAAAPPPLLFWASHAAAADPPPYPVAGDPVNRPFRTGRVGAGVEGVEVPPHGGAQLVSGTGLPHREPRFRCFPFLAPDPGKAAGAAAASGTAGGVGGGAAAMLTWMLCC